MQLGFYFDQTRCTGCSACRVACKDWYDQPAGPSSWMRIGYVEKGTFPEVFVAYTVNPCFQCESPVCADACPVEAIVKRDEDGIVWVDGDKCLGNRECDEKCRKACPYDAPQFRPEPGAKMEKCNMCLERWDSDREPICVEACPTRALFAGNMEELKAKHGSITETEGFKYSARTKPAILFKPKNK